MSRLSYDKLYLNIAKELALMSTCCKKKTGALIVKNNRILSNGYNGAPSKVEHCCDYWHKKWKETNDHEENKLSFEDYIRTQDHHSWSLKNEIHAEHNCILWAAKEGISTNQSIMYTLYSPCIYCAKAIACTGIIRVVYELIFERDPSGIEFLNQYGIECVQYQKDILQDSTTACNHKTNFFTFD